MCCRHEREIESVKRQLGETSQKVLNDRLRDTSQDFDQEKQRLFQQINEQNQTIAELRADMRGYGQRLQEKWKEVSKRATSLYH